MGVSTDGILVFGIPLEEEDCAPAFLEEYDGDFDSFLDSKNGLPQWGEPGHDWNKTHEWRKNFPIDLTRHCSHEYTMYILSVRGTEKTASRGYVEEIDPRSMIDSITQKDIDILKAFCDEYGIEWAEPKWYLCSMWG